MRLIVNGDEIEIVAKTITQLVETFEMRPEGLVVQLNQEIMEREAWEKTNLQDGDNIELLKFVGGGA